MNADKLLEQVGLEWEAPEWFDELWQLINWVNILEDGKFTQSSKKKMMEELLADGPNYKIKDAKKFMKKFSVEHLSKELPKELIELINFAPLEAHPQLMQMEYIFEERIENQTEVVKYLQENLKQDKMKRMFGSREISGKMIQFAIKEMERFLTEVTKEKFVDFLETELIFKIKKDYDEATDMEKMTMWSYWNE